MSEKKYFIATPSDLPPFFNYELNVPTRNRDSKTGFVDKWYPKSFGMNTVFSSFDIKVNLGWIRVPLLCKEDIEKRGWIIEPEAQEEKGFLAFVKDNWFLAYNENNNRLLIGTQKPDKDTFKRAILFDGICKDNSTLEFILKTISI